MCVFIIITSLTYLYVHLAWNHCNSMSAVWSIPQITHENQHSTQPVPGRQALHRNKPTVSLRLRKFARTVQRVSSCRYVSTRQESKTLPVSCETAPQIPPSTGIAVETIHSTLYYVKYETKSSIEADQNLFHKVLKSTTFYSASVNLYHHLFS